MRAEGVEWRQRPITGTTNAEVTWRQVPTSDDPWWCDVQEANRG